MSDLRPFKEVQLQWLRLLVKDTTLSARAVHFAVYLAVLRYNDNRGKAWPSHATVCKDLGLKSEKTVQRLVRELDKNWFEIKRGSGQGHSTEYTPSISSRQAAQELRETEEADKVVLLHKAKPGHSCAKSETKMSHVSGQKCLGKKEKKKDPSLLMRRNGNLMPPSSWFRLARAFLSAHGMSA
ncbi:helix-turn-helix domain-containing protein [Celeribacter naphthalenivorans]|uniref:helix-turn-helix domain-containing protein n=1 Tax=Celeribacter naphthalenivorans TaxID=1614694 RepID=UPI001CF9A2E8|nr:helix-turn-helix domain-containing protein [Celeribacter naphthalenivorans]